MSGSWPGQPAPQWPGQPVVDPPSRGMGETAAGIAGQFGAGFNRRLTDALGALPNLYDRGLQAVGLPRLFGTETATASERMLGGINSVVGTPPAPQGTAEQLAHGAGGGLVDAASVLLPAAGIARATQAAGQAPSLLNRAATVMASQPGTQIAAGMAGGAVGEATDSPLLGAATAFAVPAAVSAAGRLVSPVRGQVNPQRAALVAAAERENIPVTAGQATGNRLLQNIESQFEQLPLTAGPQRAQREGAETAFLRAAWRRAGENADDTLPATINAARNRIGGDIRTLANRNILRFTPQLDAELAQIEDSLRFIPAEAAGPVRARINQLRGMVMPPQPGVNAPPTIPGASYRMMDSQLGRSARDTNNGDLRAALTDLRERLRTAMDDSIAQGATPDDAAAWARARREYANLMVIARAAGGAGAGAAEGRMSPVALRGAVDQSTGQGYAFGRGDLNELARIGQSLLRPPPDSGTPGRTMANNLLTGSLVTGGAGAGAMAGGPLGAMGGAAASLALPRMVQALMNTPQGQAYLRNQAAAGWPGLNAPMAAALTAQQGIGYATGSRPQ